MKSQSKNLAKQNILRSIPLSLYLTSITIVGAFSIENSVASEINVPNSTPLLSKNSPPIDLSKFECDDAYDIYTKLSIQNSIMINAIMRYKPGFTGWHCRFLEPEVDFLFISPSWEV